MNTISIQTDPRVESVFQAYPEGIHQKMTQLREFILTTAGTIESITHLEETLKWGEPSFLTKKGSTIRIDWKKKTPHQYALYFQCTSKLVPIFRMIYKDSLSFEGNRAIVLQIEETLPEEILKKCLTAALTYHNVKHLPTLGI